MRLELSDRDAAVLVEVVENELSDLGYEISNTDSLDFREKLKAKKAALQRTLDRLQPTTVES
jgi:hypothetical protein